MAAALAPRQRCKRWIDLPKQHHLAAGIALGLEQQGVHAHIGLHPCSKRLKILRRANFCACATRAANATGGGGHNARVIAHVLRFEWRNAQALIGIPAAQRRSQPAFARAAGAAQHHDANGRRSRGQACACLAVRGSLGGRIGSTRGGARGGKVGVIGRIWHRHDCAATTWRGVRQNEKKRHESHKPDKGGVNPAAKPCKSCRPKPK